MLLASDTFSSVERICCLSLKIIPAKTKQVVMRNVLIHIHDVDVMCVYVKNTYAKDMWCRLQEDSIVVLTFDD